MAIPESARLRQLVDDYNRGQITLESYRNQRTSLLDNIGADPGVESADTTTRPQATERAPKPEQPDATESRSRSIVPKQVAIGIGVIVGVALIGFLGLSFLGGPETTPEIASGSDSVDRMEPGSALVDVFLENGDWTGDSLDSFIIDWEALNDEQRNELVEGRLYRRLTAQLHQRIREEIALGTGPDNGHLAALTSFAEAIGAPYRQSETADAETADAETAGTETLAVPDEEPVDVQPAAEAEPETADDAQAAVPDEAPVSPPQADGASESVSIAEQVEVETVAETQPSDPCPASLANTRLPYCKDALPEGGEGPALVVLATGSFEMGSDRFETESPMHVVNIERPVAMSAYEISVQEYLRFCIATDRECPATQSIDDAPVVSVSWEDATQYADWLTESTGFKYRLPSEAEWEYAARAGTQTPYSFGDEITPSSAHWSESGSVTAPLARSERGVNRNPFRLFHMSGNVREWVQDSWFENYRGAPTDGGARVDQAHDRKVVRGGSYRDPALELRSAAREPAKSSDRDAFTGFRVVREVSDNSLKTGTP